ncbi:hypothetical protein C8J57DRAFT_1257185 [Mycena rebaudengoi]|nr:hypothetical protein C8J57DRAFT_1257185 [Mycena rebaudengoi]
MSKHTGTISIITLSKIEILDVDKLAEPERQRFFADEGKFWLPIDVDAGEQDNPINVEMWIDMFNATTGNVANVLTLSLHTSGTQGRPIDVDEWIASTEAASLSVGAKAPTSEHLFNCCIYFGTFIKPYRKTCPICRAIIKEQPMRNELFETALEEHLKSKRSVLPQDTTGYNWEGVFFG